MSLLCSETNQDIEFGTPLYAALVPGSNTFYALSEEAIARIPKEERGTSPVEHVENGTNIYRGVSTKNFNGSYTVTGFKIVQNDFLFSISPETISEHLPDYMLKVLSEAA